MNPAPILQADGLSAGYPGRDVLHDLSFSIASGEMVGLIGPNGAGKTTLLRVMAGDIAPASGTMRFQVEPISALSHRARARSIAYVPPMLDLMSAMSVEEFIALGRTPYVEGWRRLQTDDRDAIRRALRATDLEAFADRNMHELSEGEKHRAMIALGLAQEPELLLLDEPTAHLDIKHAWQIMELIHDLHSSDSMTIVITTHDLNIASEFCSRLFLMDQGRLAATGAPTDVLKDEQLSAVYDYPVRVLSDPATGKPRVVPQRRLYGGCLTSMSGRMCD